jgi:hypothetical protein
MTRVKNFQGFMRSRLNESEEMGSEAYGMEPDTYGMYGANPEDEDAPEDAPKDGEEGDEEEEVTLDSLKAMIEDLTERVEKLEGGEDVPEDGEEAPEEGAEEGAAKK